jgi:hypothetical protein
MPQNSTAVNRAVRSALRSTPCVTDSLPPTWSIGPEDRAEFDQLLAEFRDAVQPEGALEDTLFHQLVSAAWNLRRVRRMETELCAAAQSYRELLDDKALQKKLDRLARAPPLASSLEIAKRTQHLTGLTRGLLAKRVLEAAGTEAEALLPIFDSRKLRAHRYQNRVAELQRELASPPPNSLASAA